MNHALFGEYCRALEDELVTRWGVQADDAEALMRYLRNGCIASEAEAQNINQFLLQFKELGSTEMAALHGGSPQNMRKKRTRLLKRNRRLRPQLRAEV